MGLMKGGPPSFKTVPTRGTKGVVPIGQIASGRLFAVGIILLIAGVDAVLIPGYLVLKDLQVVCAGGVVGAIGVILTYIGSKKPKSV